MTEEPGETMAKDPLFLDQDVLVILILMGLEALVGLIGNFILIRTLFLYRNLRVDIYVIIGGLAMADMFHLIIAVPSHFIDFLEAVELVTNPWCKASKYLMNSTSYIAAYHLVVLAVLRGIMLTNRGHNSPSGRHAMYCSIVVWVVGALATIPVVQVWKLDDEYAGLCFYTVYADEKKESLLRASFSCFVPITMMFLIYATTYYIGKRYFADSYSRHEKQMSRLVTAVMLSFVVCEIPFNITNLLMYNYTRSPEHYRTLGTVSDYFLCLQLLGKAIRPVLYSKLSSDLGECFDEVINCTYCHRYYSDAPKREEPEATANSRAPLTTGQPLEIIACEEVV